jgi:hypothetical protein
LRQEKPSSKGRNICRVQLEEKKVFEFNFREKQVAAAEPVSWTVESRASRSHTRFHSTTAVKKII